MGNESARVPKRIQRKRTRGWRMPEGAVYVGRPTKWGNPYRVGDVMRDIFDPRRTSSMTADDAVWFFGGHAERQAKVDATYLSALRGKDLACFCPLDQPCHADVLLELANSDDVEAATAVNEGCA